MLTPTGVTTQDYISAIKADSPVHVRMVFGTQNITIEDQDVYISSGLVLSDILNGDIDLTFGRAVMKQLTVGIINTSRVSSLIWTDEFTLEFGVEVNNVLNWVKIGTFIGERPKNITNTEVIEFTAYDAMSKFDKLVDDYWQGITFPATVESIYHGLCDYVGVSYVSGDELPNIMSRTFTTIPAQLQGYTCRDLLAWIAEACGCYAKINANGQCNMVWYTDHTSDLAFALDDEFHIETADIDIGLIWDEFDQYIWNDADKFEWNDVCSYEEVYGIDYLQVKQFGVDIEIDYPLNVGGNVYMIVENPFLSVSDSQEIQDYIKPLYDRLIAFGGHLPVNVNCVGNWLVESGDIISVDVDNTHTLNAPVYVKTLRWNGSCTDTYETTGNVIREAVSSENRGKLEARNRILLVAKDLYYNIQSGIDIEPEGVTISGGRYIKIQSGGTFEVDSANFKINSSYGYMIAGNWQFDDNGLRLDDQNGHIFEIKNIDDAGTDALVGLYFDKIDQTMQPRQKMGIAELKVLRRNLDDSSILSTTSIVAQYGTYKNSNLLDISPKTNSATLGGANAFYRVRTGSIQGDTNNTLEFSLKNNGLYADDSFFMEYANNKIYFYPTGQDDAYIGSTPNGARQFKEIRSEYYEGTYIKGFQVSYNLLVQNSSREIKHDIQSIEECGDKIDALNPVSFVYDNDKNERKHIGLIYEDTIGIMPEICTNDESNKAISYVELIPVLLKEIQNLRTRVKELEERGET